MGRLLRAAGIALLLTLMLGLLARPAPILGLGGTILHPPATLADMKQGTAHQPFVRRQLVPLILRSVDRIISTQWRETAAKSLEASRLVRPLLFDSAEGEDFDSFVCLIVWFICFTVFVAAFEAETSYYAGEPDPGGDVHFAFAPWFTMFACLMLVALLHNNYIYDPPTLCFAMLTLRALRQERFLELLLLTALFSLNRETAFIVPGLTFLFWIHRGRISTAYWQAAMLSSVYLVIVGSLAFHYRHNSGSAAENNRIYLVHTYIHKNAAYAVAAILAWTAYTYAVMRRWKLLPATLKAVQWFVPLWIAMHILWGWPMEWRVFFEIYPGMMLTVAAIWMKFSDPQADRP